MSTSQAVGSPRAQSIVSFLNPLIQRLLRVGLPYGPHALLTVRGRTSGVPRTFLHLRATSTPEEFVAVARVHPMFELRSRVARGPEVEGP